VTQEEHTELWEILEDTDCGRWAQDKLRCDYDPAREELVLRMASVTHNMFLDNLTEEIWDQLKTLRASDEKAQNVMGSLGRMMMGFKLPNRGKKYPDGAFGSTTKKYPRLVIEIANSQSPKNLKDLAYTYIQASLSQIRTVLTVDLEYLPPAQRSQRRISNAVYSIYRLHVETGPDGRRTRRIKADVENRSFRFNGNTPDGNLVLKLSDFLSTSCSEEVNNPTISISHSSLTAILAAAEELQAIHDGPPPPYCDSDGELDDLPDVTSQPVSESEELTAEDEMAEAGEQRRDESDSSYEPRARRPLKKRRRV
jgi:hypothetical protein